MTKSESDTENDIDFLLSLNRAEQAKRGIWSFLMDWIMHEVQSSPDPSTAHEAPLQWMRDMLVDMERLITHGQDDLAKGNNNTNG